MLVQVGNRIFDAEHEPVMVILSPRDKANIANMQPEATKYCCFPPEMSPDAVEKWMMSGINDHGGRRL
jgi:hypothetical protein